MKKILILVSKRGDKKEKFVSYLQKYFGGKVEVTLGVFPDLTFQIETGNVVVEIDGRNINDFDLVYFRNTLGFQSMAAGLAIYLKSRGTKFFDELFFDGSFVGDKFTSLMRLAVSGIPVVPSFVCWNETNKIKKEIVERLGFPVVAKEVRTQRMQSIYLLKTLEDFDKLPCKVKNSRPAHYLFQKFVNFDKEFRVLVLGKKVGIVHTKTARDNTGFKVGYSDMEEYPVFLDPNDVSSAFKETAIKAANVLHIQVAGVDICEEKRTGKIFVFEVNRGPGVDYDTNVSQELLKMAEFLSFELDNK